MDIFFPTVYLRGFRGFDDSRLIKCEDFLKAALLKSKF